MAGGSGERFWPLSRRLHPKQLLKLTSPDESLLQEAVNRLLPLVAAEDIFIATSDLLRGAIRQAGLGLPLENVLAEPLRRNTAGCLCWAASVLATRFPGEDIVIGVVTADHLIGDADRFRGCIARAFDAAATSDALVTIGVKPDRPETGYGYIEVGRDEAATGPRAVERFREKPNLSLAQDFLASGQHFWNSGMFFWRLGTFLSQLEVASPAHHAATLAMRDALACGDEPKAVNAFEALPNLSIDYALMERARAVLMVEADFPWDDVGAWDALERSRVADAEGNVVEGGAILKEVKSSIVLNDAGAEHVAVGVIGVENLIVIVTKDAVLVCPKGMAQEVRLVPRELEKRGLPQI
jgi:mannose-1-phosphate guanylyltransferase